jgi:hypothetical protein
VPHRAADDSRSNREALSCQCAARDGRFEDLGIGVVILRMKSGSKAEFDVSDAILDGVLARFVENPGDGIGCCITLRTMSNVFRYVTRSGQSRGTVISLASSVRSVTPRSTPCSSASAFTVAGRAKPSRWQCSSAFGSSRMMSSVRTGEAMTKCGA